MKNNILFIVHQWVDNSNYSSTLIGGTSLHLFDIIKKIRINHNCFVLYQYKDYYQLGIYTESLEKVFQLNVKVKSKYFEKYDEEYSRMLSDLIDILEIDFVHIHHLIGHSLDIVPVLRKKNIRTIVTLHDYFMICPRVNLLYKNKEYCNFESSKLCKKCCSKRINFGLRNSVVDELLNYADTVIVPNVTVSDIFKKIHPSAHYKTIEHGTNFPVVTINYDNNRKNHKKFNVAFVGFLNKIKGGEIAKQLILNSSKNDFAFHLFGISDDPFFNQDRRNFTSHGEYNRENIIGYLKKNKIDIVCFLSICPETYCYTLSEVLMAGIPALGYDIGAVGERIKRLKIGWVCPLDGNYVTILNKLMEIRHNLIEYHECLGRVENLKLQSVDKMVEETIAEYTFSSIEHKSEFSFECLNNLSISTKELKITRVSKTNKKSIIKFIKRKIPYSVKRPFYLFAVGLKKILKGSRRKEK